MATPTNPPLQGSTDIEIWLAAKNRFLEGLGSDVERVLFDEATVENVFSSAIDANRDDDKSKVRDLAIKLDPLVAAVNDFGEALDVFTGIAPTYLGPIWGSIRCLLVLARKYRGFFDRLVETLSRIGDLIPRFRSLQRIFDPQKHHRLMTALSNSYLDIILLCIRFQTILKSQRKSKLARVFQPLSPALNAELDDAVKRFRDHRKMVEKESEIAHMIEEADARAMVEINKKAELRKRLLSSLSIVNYEGKHRKIRNKSHPNSGSWVFISPEYKSWLNAQETSVLCCYGIPGCGKSVLTSIIVDSIIAKLSQFVPKTAIGYYYCDYADKRTLDPVNILGTLARELLQTIEIPKAVEDLIITSYGDGMRIPQTEEVLQILIAIMANYDNVILILDGLDETNENDGILLRKNLFSLLAAYTGTLRLFVSCREDVTSLIANPFTPSFKIQVQAATISADIAEYVSHSIDELLATKDLVIRNESLKDEIIKALVEGAKGMFLWVFYVLGDLCSAETDDEIRKMLQNLPQNLSETYDRLLGRIVGETRRNLIQKMFSWITCARRPLLLTELQEGIAFHLDDDHWDRDKIPTDMTRLIRACSNLVLVDEESGIVEFAHYTIMQYLLSSKNAGGSQFHFNIRDANNLVGEVCVSYLCFSDFETQLVRYVDTTTANMSEVENVIINQQLPYPVAAAMKIWYSFRGGYSGKASGIDYAKHIPKHKPPTTEILNKYCLLAYVIDNWLWHSVNFLEYSFYSPTSAKTLTESLDSMKYGDPRRHTFLEALVLQKTLLFDIRPWELCLAYKKMPILFPLGYALSTNHLPLLAIFAKNDSSLEPRQLVEAAGKDVLEEEYSSIKAPYKLSEKALDRIRTRDRDDDPYGWFYVKLVIASRLGHSNVLAVCFDTPGFPGAVRNHLLIEAASCGHLSTVRLLCIKGSHVQAEFTCDYNNSPLNAIERAALAGHSHIVSFLKKENHRAVHLDIAKAISSAVNDNDKNVLMALLILGHVGDIYSGKQSTMKWQKPRIPPTQAQIIVSAMADAAHRNDLATVLILLEAHVPPHNSEFLADSPLLVAVKKCRLQMVQAMLESYKCIVDHHGSTGSPLLWAAAKGNTKMVDLLLQHGHIVPVDEWPSPLFAACSHGYTSVVESLLQTSANMDIGCRHKRLLLSNLKNIPDLIDHDEMLDVDDGYERNFSPLYAAIFNGHIGVVATLLRKGASIDVWSQQGNTASGACFWDSLETIRSLLIMINLATSSQFTLADYNVQRYETEKKLIKRIHQSLLNTVGLQGSAKRLRNFFTAGLIVDPLNTRPLLFATTEQRSELLHALWHQSGGDIIVRDQWEILANNNFHKTTIPLITATIQNDIRSLKILLAAGAQVDTTDDNGTTALSLSILHNHLEVFTVLCSYGASFTRCDSLGGWDAFQCIIESERRSFLEFMASRLVASTMIDIGPLPFTRKQVVETMKAYNLKWWGLRGRGLNVAKITELENTEMAS